MVKLKSIIVFFFCCIFGTIQSNTKTLLDDELYSKYYGKTIQELKSSDEDIKNVFEQSMVGLRILSFFENLTKETKEHIKNDIDTLHKHEMLLDSCIIRVDNYLRSELGSPNNNAIDEFYHICLFIETYPIRLFIKYFGSEEARGSMEAYLSRLAKIKKEQKSLRKMNTTKKKLEQRKKSLESLVA